jgi:glutamate transport system ATP-binding protein
MADRVAVMYAGQIVEQASPEEFFQTPRTERAKEFLSKILAH